MKFHTFLFDFDGTLVDSMPTFAAAILKILKGNNIPYTKEIIETMTPLGYKQTVQYFKELGVKMSGEEIFSVFNEYALNEYKFHIEAKKNVIETLRTLKSRNVDLNILTACPHLMLDVCLKRLGIYNLFTNVWSCDDFNTSKSDPEIYKMAAEKIGKPIEEILFLDDNLNANKTAKKSGIKVCGVYDESSEDSIDDIKRIADFYIYDFSELLEW